MKKAAYICLLFIFIGCSSKPAPKDILSVDKMQKVVYDLMQVDQYLNNFVIKDSLADIKKKRSVYYEQVFKLNNTNRKEFYTSYKYYQQHPDMQKVLFDSISAKAGRGKILPVRIPPIKPSKIK
jgi:DNA-directed RNA polymerase